MAESHPSKKFLLRLGFPKRATVCFNVARGFVPPCNLSTTGICCLMDVVADCNKALWCLGLQIRDDARDEVGEVGVAIIRSLGRGYLAAFLKSDPGLLALAVLFFLFEEHNCIVAVELFDVIAKNRAVLFSLRKIPALKRLAIVVDLDEQPEGVGGLVEFVQSVVVADGVQLKFIDGNYSPDYQTSLLHNALRHQDSKIKALDLTGLTIGADCFKTLCSALEKNNSVTELAVGSLLFGPRSKETPEFFVKYLRVKKATLKKLQFHAPDVNTEKSFDLMRNLVAVICEMTSLEELTAKWFRRASDIGLIGSVVASAKNLRTLEVRHCCDLWAQSDTPSNDRSVIEPWITALAKTQSLERLTMDLSLYTPEECSMFIDAIAVNVSIVTVTVTNIGANGCLRDVYTRIRHHKMHRRVVVEDHHIGLRDVEELSFFNEARAVTLSSWHLEHSEALCAAIDELAVCSHVTSLRLRFPDYDSTLYAAVANYLSATGTVNDIEVYVNNMRDASDDHDATAYRIIEVLASNRNVQKVKLNLERLSDTCCQLIADSILQNGMLYELSLEALGEPSCAMLLQCLIPGLVHNYSLLVARLPDYHGRLDDDMATLHDVTRRNSRLVDLAIRFVTGNHRDSSTEGLLPLVSSHPKLIHTVAQKAGVTNAEAHSIIKHLLSFPPFSV